MLIRNLLYIIIIITFINCQQEKVVAVQITINGETIQKHLEELSSDKYTGRMPCTAGGQLTVDYLIKQLQALNIEPGNGSSYTQDVPLLTIDGTMSDNMDVLTPTGKLTWNKGKDFVIHTQRKADKLSLDNSELVFCGYGIVDA